MRILSLYFCLDFLQDQIINIKSFICKYDHRQKLDKKQQPEYSLPIKLQRYEKPARFQALQNLWAASHFCSAVLLLIRMMGLYIKNNIIYAKPGGM